MKNNDFEFVLTHEKIDFVKNFNIFAQKVCQNLPFSNVLLISFDSDFFSFGNQIEQNLLSHGARVKSVIIRQDNLSQIGDFIKKQSLVLEFRAIVVFNKKILCHLNSIAKFSLPKIFYLQVTSDVYYAFNSNRLISIDYFFCPNDIQKTNVLKTFSLRALALIDYIFCKALTKKPLDLDFFQKAKRQLVLSLVCGESETSDSLLKKLIMLEKDFSAKSECKSYSASVVCKLMQKSFCDLSTSFIASKQIIKRYKQVLSNRFTTKLSFSDRARLISFYSGKSLNYALGGLYKQLSIISGAISDSDVKEIKSLIKVFDRFVCMV